MNETPFLDSKQLAEAMNVPESWVRERSRPGVEDPIPTHRFGKYTRFLLEEVLAHLKKKGGK